MSKYAGSSQEDFGFQLMVDDTGDGVRIWRATDAFTLYSATINTSTWYHIVVTYGGGQARVYLNTSEIGSATTMTLGNKTSDFRIGDLQKYVGNNFDGLIDIVEVYDRVLTSGEISALYNSGSGVACTGRSSGGETTPIFEDVMWYN